ncbi:Imm3 family immunity protein [Brevibacillus gelatini]|uniref:Imm3 family immunity protein n=1 Tax=Brevibacillus gelatini TaxID=1655277 RepID=UPI003D8190C1
MDWEYEELFEAFNEDYMNYRSENFSPWESLARTWGEYENVINRGEMEKAVIYVAYGEKLLLQEKIFTNAKKLTLDALNTLDLAKLQSVLDEEQMEELLARRSKVLEQLESKPLDQYPVARWYYREITEEVVDFINKKLQEAGSNDLVSVVLKRFERDCKNTIGENIIIKTTLIESLMGKVTEKEKLEPIVKELKEFKVDELGQQLSEDEKKDLLLRIKACI